MLRFVAQLVCRAWLQWLSCQGRPCKDAATLQDVPVSDGSVVRLHTRLCGGGGDGGSTGAESRVSYLEMYASKRPEKVRTPLLSAVRLAYSDFFCKSGRQIPVQLAIPNTLVAYVLQ